MKYSSNLQIYTKDRFKRWCQNGVISWVVGLFIFIKTIVLVLEQCEDPMGLLKVMLHDSEVGWLARVRNSSVVRTWEELEGPNAVPEGTSSKS